MIGIFFSIAFLVIVCVLGNLNTEAARVTDFSRKNLAPCSSYIFGTDWLGRDMLARTLKGLSMSILIGVVSAAVSAVVAPGSWDRGSDPGKNRGQHHFFCH